MCNKYFQTESLAKRQQYNISIFFATTGIMFHGETEILEGRSLVPITGKFE